LSGCLASFINHKKSWLWYDYSDFTGKEAFTTKLKNDFGNITSYTFSDSNELNKTLKKQDKRTGIYQKVSNPKFMKQWFEDFGLEFLGDPNTSQNFSVMANLN
jgi:hypothetical protein